MKESKENSGVYKNECMVCNINESFFTKIGTINGEYNSVYDLYGCLECNTVIYNEVFKS